MVTVAVRPVTWAFRSASRIDGKPSTGRKRHAVGDDVDVEAVVGDRRAFSRQVVNRRVDADLDALDRAAFDPVDHPFANYPERSGSAKPASARMPTSACRQIRASAAVRPNSRLLPVPATPISPLLISAWVRSTRRLLRYRSAGRSTMRLKISGGSLSLPASRMVPPLKAQLPVGDVVVGGLKMRQQRDPVLRRKRS